GQLQAQARLDASGDVETHGAARPHAALTVARRAGVLDARAVPLTGSAGLLRHDVSEQAAHLTLHVPRAAAHIARHGLRAGLRHAAVARLAQHRGVDLDVAVRAEDDVSQLQAHAHERVVAPLAA